jgi:hypothetical protein
MQFSMINILYFSIIIIIIIIIIIPVTTFIQCTYNYVPDTNHVSSMYSVASVLNLQFVLHVMLLHCSSSVLLH